MADFDIRVVVDPSGGVRGVQRVQRELRSTERVASNVGRKIAAALAAAFAGVGIAASLKAFSNIEQGLIGVAKTADLTAKEMVKLRDSVTEVSRVLPFTRTELLSIAQAAGQLGVKGVANLALFSETIAKLGTASDLAGAEAATALVRILNVTGEGTDAVDIFASVIVRLGNNFAATESEILRMANEVARATALFGVSSTEAAALGAALKSMGVRAELGGSSIGRAFFAIQAAIQGGGEEMKNLSNLTGIAIDDLEQAFAKDAVAVFEKFTLGLGALGGASEITQALESFGLKGQEVLKVLPVLAKNSKLVGDALRQAGLEAENATALNEEVARAMDSAATAGQLFTNSIFEIVEAVGEAMTPAFIDAADSVREFIIEAQEGETLPAIYEAIGAAAQGSVDAIGFLTENTELLAVAIALLIARQIGLAASSHAAAAAMVAMRTTAAALAISVALAGTAATAGSVALTLLSGAATLARAALARLVLLFGGPVGLAVAVGIATFAFVAYITRSQSAAEAADVVRESISKLTDEFGDQESGIDSLTEKYRTLSETKLQNALIDLQIEFSGLEASTKTLDSEVKSSISGLVGMRRVLGAIGPASGSVAEAAIAFEQLRIKGEDTEEAVREVIQRLIDVGKPEVARGLNEMFQSFSDGQSAIEGVENRLLSVQLLLSQIGGTPTLDLGRRDRALADVEVATGETTPIKPSDSGGVSFRDIERDLVRERDLVGLTNAAREIRIELFRAEDALERKLSTTQRERIEGLVAERQELENQEAIADRIQDLQTEGDLLRLSRFDRLLVVETLRLEEQLYRALTDAERGEIETLTEQNRLLAVQARLREDFTGGFDDIADERAAFAALFEEGIISTNAFRNALLELDAVEIDLRIRLGDGTFADGFIGGMLDMTEAAQNFAAETGEVFSEFIGRFSQGFGDAFAGAILGTEKLGKSLKNVARNAIGQLISALIQMGIQYLILQATGSAAGSAAAAVSAGEAALVAAAWAPAAAAVSLASYGANAAPAGLGITVVFALVAALAAAAGAFLFLRDGGRVSGPGTGSSDSVRAMLSNGEFVVNAPQTAKFLPILERMNRGDSISDIVFGEIGQGIQNLRTPMLARGGLVEGPQVPGMNRTFDLISRGTDDRTAEILDRQNIPGLSFPDLFSNPATETITIAPTFVFQSREAVDEFKETEGATMAQLGRVIEESTRRRQIRRGR